MRKNADAEDEIVALRNELCIFEALVEKQDILREVVGHFGSRGG
jgi:hypothetical protein